MHFNTITFYLDTPSHIAEIGKELIELCSLGIREGDILRFKKIYTKLLNTEVVLSFKVLSEDFYDIYFF